MFVLNSLTFELQAFLHIFPHNSPPLSLSQVEKQHFNVSRRPVMSELKCSDKQTRAAQKGNSIRGPPVRDIIRRGESAVRERRIFRRNGPPRRRFRNYFREVRVSDLPDVTWRCLEQRGRPLGVKRAEKMEFSKSNSKNNPTQK